MQNFENVADDLTESFLDLHITDTLRRNVLGKVNVYVNAFVFSLFLCSYLEEKKAKARERW